MYSKHYWLAWRKKPKRKRRRPAGCRPAEAGSHGERPGKGNGGEERGMVVQDETGGSSTLLPSGFPSWPRTQSSLPSLPSADLTTHTQHVSLPTGSPCYLRFVQFIMDFTRLWSLGPLYQISATATATTIASYITADELRNSTVIYHPNRITGLSHQVICSG